MPVDQSAANRYQSNAQAAGDEYSANATTEAWRAGVADGDIESGLAAAGVSNVQGSGLQQKWEQGVNEATFRTDQSAYESAVGQAGDEWLSGMSDASDWNI